MTRAFAAIAANAEGIEPYAIRSIKSGDQSLFSRPASVVAPARNQAARADMRDLLASVVREGTGRAARVEPSVAGKTGTSQESRDAWFVGFTRDLVIGVWVGNDDNSPTRNVTGGDMPARIFAEFVTKSMAARAKVARLPAAASGIATTGVSLEPKPQPGALAVRGMANTQTTGVIELGGR